MFTAGFFDVTSAQAKNLAICSYHRDRLGVYWRDRRKMCQVPPDIANHDDSKMKGDRSVLKWHSIYIKQLTGATVPVGSGKKKLTAKYTIITAIVVVFYLLSIVVTE